MNTKNEGVSSLSFLSAILFLQVTFYLLVLFNIPVARQIVGFFYFTFVPGYIVVKLFKFRLEWLETVVFSVGFSIAFLMLVGLALNELGFMFGILQPLSTVPLLIVLNQIILAGAIITYLKDESFKLPNYVSLGSIGRFLPLALPLGFSVVGALFVSVYGDNRLLLVMILAVSLVVAVLTLKGSFPSRIYAFMVFVIGISLLYHSSLISKYLITFGSDAAFEQFVFKNTLKSGYWNSTFPVYWGESLGRLNDMLSITILPTIYSNLLDLDSTSIFKLIFPLIFAFLPLCLYQLWKKSFGAKCAFVSAFFFMAPFTFYFEMLGLNRQMISEVFFGLLLFVVLDKQMKRFQKLFSFTFFSFGLITSHYGLSEIFLLLLVFALVCLLVFRRHDNNLTIEMGVLFFVMMFTWYIYTSNASVFESFLIFGEYIREQLGEFFNPKSRGEIVLRGLGLESSPTIWNTISRVFAYITELLIVVGFVYLLLKRKSISIGWVHFMLILGAIGFLTMLIVVPGLANTMSMTRFYHVLLFFLAPLCTLGANFLVEIVFKNKNEVTASILIVGVLIPYFLFQIGFVYEITKSQSWSLPLSRYRMNGYLAIRELGYVPEQNIYGVKWLGNHSVSSYIYADINSIQTAFPAYGSILLDKIRLMYNTTKFNANEIIFFEVLNVKYGIVDSGSIVWNVTDISSFVGDLTKVYTNGESEIYQNIP